MPRLTIPIPDKTAARIDREHNGHVRKIKRPRPGSLPHAEGHSLRMVMTVSYQCECGLKLGKKSVG